MFTRPNLVELRQSIAIIECSIAITRISRSDMPENNWVTQQLKRAHNNIHDGRTPKSRVKNIQYCLSPSRYLYRLTRSLSVGKMIYEIYLNNCLY